MSRTLQTNNRNAYGSQQGNSSTTVRTYVERGTRLAGSGGNVKDGTSSTMAAITTIAKQHEDEQHELQELNSKFAIYLDRVFELEDYHGRLLAELEALKEAWGGDTNKLHATYGKDLEALRKAINDSLRDQARPELLSQQYEYTISHLRQGINILNIDASGRIDALQRELKMSLDDLGQLKDLVERRAGDLLRQRTNLGNLTNQIDALQNELINIQLERLMLENELQTLREEAGFLDAIYQAQRQEIAFLSTPIIDISKFYQNELTRAIFDIRQDFEVLSQSQTVELEEYYRIKTEQVREQIAQENERKRLLITESETTEKTLDFSSLTSLNKVYKELQAENSQLQIHFDGILEDLLKIEEEHNREKYNQDRELALLREELSNKQAILDGVLDSNVSLRFELSTYRRLLNSEEQRLNRIEYAQVSQTSSSSASKNENVSDLSVQKMAIQKSEKGPILFDSIDFINDCITITYEKSFGSEQPLNNWTLVHQNDKQSEIVYQFPSSFILRPRQTVRIVTRRTPQSIKTGRDVLVANQIDTWGHGDSMVTRLLNKNKEEIAAITHNRISR